MDGLISRQAAIGILDQYTATLNPDRDNTELGRVDRIRRFIEQLPSAQPDFSVKIQEILNYLDTNMHPLVSPEHWNVYSELYDMISGLSSEQPERKKGILPELWRGCEQ